MIPYYSQMAVREQAKGHVKLKVQYVTFLSIHNQSIFRKVFCLILIHYGKPIISVYILEQTLWFLWEITYEEFRCKSL